MNTPCTLIVSTYTQAAINQFEEYLRSTDFNSANISHQRDTLLVEFPEGTKPSPEFIQKVGNIFYWSNELSNSHLDGAIHYYDFTNSLLINLSFYEEICQVCEKLKSFKIALTAFELGNSGYTFTYDIHGRSPLSYTELLEIEQIINPEEKEELKHLVVFRMDVYYTLTVKHKLLKN
ncbi:MAG: hypothetical protein IKL55_04590 [Clostridia bacterium]|nr:hypothetical protein [Clostridia bacterium]